MALPTNRDEFKMNCVRRLGFPVTDVNLDEDQIQDRIDEALSYYWEYHFDGNEKVYYKHIITDSDKTNKYITLPDNIIGAVRIFDLGTALGTNNMFNIRYQIALNDLYTLTSVSMIPYYMAMSHIQMLEQLLVGQQPIRYNKHTNIIKLDMDWDRFNVGDYVIIEAYQVVDPATYTDVWKDRWLLRYAACLIKQQYGSNLTKHIGAQMTGPIKLNGDKIYNDATLERSNLENEMVYTYSLPVSDFVGAVLLLLNTSIVTYIIGVVYETWNSLPLV